jgi:hypothetical protein
MKMRMTRRGAGMLIALMLIAVPAAAAVMTQTFVKATASLEDTCFDLEAGNDATRFPGLVTFDAGPTIQAAGGNADLVAAEVTVKGQVGDRVVYSDVAFFTNDCGSVTLRLLSASDPAGGDELEPAVGSGSIWEDVDIYVYVQNASGIPLASNPIDDPADWTEMLSVVNGSVSESGSVTMTNGTERRLAFVIDTSSDFVVDLANPANNRVVWRWTAQASYN